MKRLLWLTLISACLLMGCATTSRFGDVENELAAAAGVMTLEEAIDRWGQPSSMDKGELLTVAYWRPLHNAGRRHLPV